MNNRHDQEVVEISFSAQRRNHEKIERFIADWKAWLRDSDQSVPRPEINPLLVDCAGSEREVLLSELIDADVFHRRKCGEKPQPEDYDDIPGALLAASVVLREGQRKILSRQAEQVSPERQAAIGSIGHADPDATVRSPPLHSIAGYEIIRELHRGGQGIVYQAVQRSTKRNVALKVMLEGPFAGAESRRRFEREIELIGSLKSPRIVPIFDSGEVDGWFYYVMEYVHGETLERHVKARQYSVNQSLTLFKKLCSAVDYAHQKGVIHRDLKPSNILVDEEGEPHVLDFGLAKVHQAEAAQDGSLRMSVTGQVMGTLSYMSPEQAAGRPDLVDMRSDVYALGVILYELLTGQLPYELSGQMADRLSAIQNADPRRPSTVRHQVTDEVETIVLKSLSKDKERRYYAAGPLGQDIQRYLDGDPIEAKRDSALYVMRKLLRRHKAPVAAAITLICVIIAALLVSLTFWRSEVEQRKRAELIGYARDMNIAQHAWHAANIPRMQELLDRHRDSKRNDDPRSFMWQYLKALLQQVDSTPGLYKGSPSQIQYFADDKLIVVDENDIISIDLDSGQQEKLLEHQSPVEQMAYSARANLLMVRDGNDMIIGWDCKERQERVSWKVAGQKNWYTAFAVSANGALVASALTNEERSYFTIKVWEVAAGRELYSLDAARWVDCLAFSPNRDLLFSGDRGDNVTIWAMDTGNRVSQWKAGNRRIYSLALSHDGKTLISGGLSNTISLWDTSTYTKKHEFTHSGGLVGNMLMTPDDRTLIVSFLDDTVGLYDVRLGAPAIVVKERLLLKLKAQATSLAISPAGIQFAAVVNNDVHTWPAETVDQPTELRRTLIGTPGFNPQLTFSNDGRMLASGGEIATVWNLDTGTRTEFTGGGRSVAFSADGSKLVTASRGDVDVTVRTWDITSQTELATFDCHNDYVWAVAMAADGVIASGGRGGQFWLHDAESGESMSYHFGFQTDYGFRVDIMSIKFSADGKKLLVAGGNFGHRMDTKEEYLGVGVVKVYQRDGLSLVESQELPRQPRIVYEAAFSPDGRLVASASYDGAVKLWEVDTGKLKYHLRGHTTWANSVAFTPDGKTLASSSKDTTVKLWQVATGEEIGTFENDENVTCLAFSPDGKTLASQGEGGRITLWGQ